MVEQFHAPGAAGATPGAGRTILEMPFAGSLSLEVGAGIVFVSADGTWGRLEG